MDLPEALKSGISTKKNPADSQPELKKHKQHTQPLPRIIERAVSKKELIYQTDCDGMWIHICIKYIHNILFSSYKILQEDRKVFSRH